jgi:hypothetical protein
VSRVAALAIPTGAQQQGSRVQKSADPFTGATHNDSLVLHDTRANVILERLPCAIECTSKCIEVGD